MTCKCIKAGFCEVRQCPISPSLWKLCQSGQGERVDGVLQEIKFQRENLRSNNIPQKIRNQQMSLREPVGTALKLRIEKITTIKTSKGCGCNNLAKQMDGWGISGCEGMYKETIINSLVANKDILFEAIKEYGWVGYVSGLAIQLFSDSMLRSGAEWLLSLAINDVKKQVELNQPQKKNLQRLNHNESIAPSER